LKVEKGMTGPRTRGHPSKTTRCLGGGTFSRIEGTVKSKEPERTKLRSPKKKKKSKPMGGTSQTNPLVEKAGRGSEQRKKLAQKRRKVSCKKPRAGQPKTGQGKFSTKENPNLTSRRGGDDRGPRKKSQTQRKKRRRE